MKIRYNVVTSLFFLIFTIGFVHSAGSQDKSFYDIDKNISENQYNDALLMLNDYIQENPEDFDNAQKRVKEIMDVRSRYAELAEEIIYVIINEPTNDEKKLKMIAELEAIEENPSPSTREFIAQTKAAAEFTYYRSKFEEIITKGSAETQNQNYISSLRTNFTGFELYRTHFHEAGYEADFVNSVEAKISEIENNINQYEKLKLSLDEAYKNLVKNLESGTLSKINDAYITFENRMKDFAEIRNFIVEAGWYFRDSFEDLQEKDPTLTEASFLAFAYRFVLGRASTEDSGMISALDDIWTKYIAGLRPYISENIAKIFLKNDKTLAEINLSTLVSKSSESKNNLGDIQSFINLGISVENLKTFMKESSENFYSTENASEMVALLESQALVENYISVLENAYDFDGYVKAVNGYKPPENPDKEVSEMDFSYRSFIAYINQNINGLENNAKDILASQKGSHDDFQWKESFILLEKALSYLNSEYEALESKNEDNLSSWFVEASTNIAAGHTEVYQNAYIMLNENLSPDVLSYPAELQPIINESMVKIQSDIEALTQVVGFYETDLTSKSREKSLVQNDIKTLRALYNDCVAILPKAKERVKLSELAKNEAELRYNQAENALAKNDYAACRDYIEKARTKYNESLLYQESETLRQESDEKLMALGEQIIRAENEIVVREVRDLKTRAKNAYYAGNFENAENLLSQAKIRWATTNTECDQEIESLLSLIGNALSLKTGRTISPTAPLYPEMSQLLNIANQYYNEGKSLLAKKQTVEAEISLQTALQKLREVQTVYPLNQEASLLTLRINKLIDEDAFNEYFTRKVENAKNDYKDKAKQQTVYSELLDLYEINPSYPGLKDFIYNVEIALGIRVKPPDTTALKKSTQLTAQAQKVYDADSRNEISLNSALQLINQALEANPDNTEAQILKDRISTSLGGTGTAVLPANAEKLYQQAVQELQKGNTLQAYVIVSQLMENKSYSKASKIIDLMKKVESLL